MSTRGALRYNHRVIQRLKDDLRAAMKRRDEVTVRVLRMVLADLHNREIASKADLTEEQVFAGLRTAVKQRQDAAEQFAAGGRPDRADEELAEIDVITPYLPTPLAADELAAAVEDAIAACGASSSSDMGKVMGHLMSRYEGRIDGKAANALVRERLAAS